ncbi:MAG: peptidoglycan-binding protein [Sphingomicrobium sp.]
MTEQTLARAALIELKQDLSTELPGGKKVDVQFNPESMKVTLANQVEQPKSGDQSAGTAGIQFVGAGNSKLALTLWFDVTAMAQNPLDDVRRLTREVVYFMNPKPSERDKSKLSPPGLRFSWGSFIFDGVIEGLEESLEFFSAAGKPLRSSIALTMMQQKILVAKVAGSGVLTGRPGQRPFAAAKQGQSLQQMANASGKGGNWQSIADANGVEDPLRMPPGKLIDLDAKVTAGANLGAGFSAGSPAGLDLGAMGSTGLGIG